MKGRVRAEGVGFVIFLGGGLLKLRFQNFPFDDALWWGVAIVFVLVLLWELCFLSPYEHVKALTDEHNEEIRKFGDTIADIEARLSDYDETPVFPIVEMSSNVEPISVKLINKGKDEEPIESVCLYLCDGDKNEPFRILNPDPSGKRFPLTMGRKTNLRVSFDILGAHCIQWGVQSVFAVVSLQDGRERESERYTIRNSSLDGLLAAPVVHTPGRTWEQSMVRHKRIHQVARTYTRACARRSRVMGANRLRELNDAQIRGLEDASEVRELLTILDANKVHHPFKHREDPDTILHFYQDAIPERVSIGGIMEWNAAYNKWFTPATPLSPTPNTEQKAEGQQLS